MLYLFLSQLTGQAAELSLKGSPYWMAPEVPSFATLNRVECGFDSDITICSAAYASCNAEGQQLWSCTCSWYLESGLYDHWNVHRKTSLEWLWGRKLHIFLTFFLSFISWGWSQKCRNIQVFLFPSFFLYFLFFSPSIFQYRSQQND